MSVKARFTVNKIEITGYRQQVAGQPGQPAHYQTVEMRTVVMTPVYSNDPDDPNKRFWDATPSGELRLGTINRNAWAAFEVGRTYELTFEPVEGS